MALVLHYLNEYARWRVRAGGHERQREPSSSCSSPPRMARNVAVALRDWLEHLLRARFVPSTAPPHPPSPPTAAPEPEPDSSSSSSSSALLDWLLWLQTQYDALSLAHLFLTCQIVPSRYALRLYSSAVLIPSVLYPYMSC